MAKEQYDKIRKGKFRWDPAKAKAWGDKQRARNKARAESRAASGEASNMGGAAGTGGVSGGTGPVGAGNSDGNKSHSGGHRRGSFDLGNETDPSKEKEKSGGAEQPNIDLDAAFETLPDLFKLFVLGLDNWARLITGDPRIKVWVYFEPLSDKEAKTLSAFSRPYLEAHLFNWIRENPGLAFMLAPLFIIFFKTRVKVKKTKPGGVGPVVDAEWTEVPLKREAA